MSIKVLKDLLKRKKGSVENPNSLFEFVDLMPVNFADDRKSYSKALEFAFDSERIKNIALTGPYGSGKSSIIKTFEDCNRDKYCFLNISLASFKEHGKVSSEDDFQSLLVERSILQQMLYGSDANNLPYSRFKRILTPRNPFFKSLFFVIWGMSFYILYQNKNSLLKFNFSSDYWWLLCGLGVFLVFSTALIISEIYKATFGISLKKISLKNAEIETASQSEDSILNRHLDEIIYFFQMTNYDVVIIEDLDRFGDPEIFVKLREINKLINDSAHTNGNIKFLYALRDDMFLQKSRAKFFDFIIPVVPIINSSNSLDKMQERLKSVSFEGEIDTQFLRGVSLHIDDLRLIHNIFNEFLIYYDRLKSENLDVTKLLAMMIYKNVYPSDFECLHHGGGVFYEIVMKKSIYVKAVKKDLKDRIDSLRLQIKNAGDERVRSSRELIDSYVGYMVSYSQGNEVVGVVCGNQHIPFSELAAYEKFEPLINEEDIRLARRAQFHTGYQIPIGKSFQEIESEINPNETFLSRNENIENRSDEKIKVIQSDINQLEKEILALPQVKLSQLLRDGELNFYDVIGKDSKLLEYLIKNGFLDENYNDYISNFHEGRLTKNDRDFLITINNFHQPEPDQKIDTPEEVCANMREEDFGHKYILNITLVDYLLYNCSEKKDRITRSFQYISDNYNKSENFFEAYLVSGENVELFIQKLCEVWPKFSNEAVRSKQSAEIISYILRFVNKGYVVSEMNDGGVISSYLKKNGGLVFCSNIQPPEEYSVLKSLGVKFSSLLTLDKNKDLTNYLHKENLYDINIENVNYILQKFPCSIIKNDQILEQSNYTSIGIFGSDYVKEYINDNLIDYIDRVFLEIPDNSKEDEVVIKQLLNSKVLDKDRKKKVISKQECIFKSIKNISDDICQLLFEEGKINISWGNISSYLKTEESDEDFIIDYIQGSNNFEKLSSEAMSIEELGDDDAKSLSYLLFSSDIINDNKYGELIKCLPYRYSEFPSDVSKEKLLSLVRENIIVLTEKSFEKAVQDSYLASVLIEKNFDVYLEDKDSYKVGDDIRELLLLSEISNDHKIEVCHDISAEGALGSNRLLSLMTDIILLDKVDCNDYDDEILSAAIINASNEDLSIRLLIKCLPSWEEGFAMTVVSQLDHPYNLIALYGRRPKLQKTALNVELSALLKEKGFISSLKEDKDSIRVITRRA